MKTFKQFLTENNDFTTLAGKTARSWKTTTTYNVALNNVIKQGDKVLDYGSGPYQKVKPSVVAKGAEYNAYDKYGNIGDSSMLHDNDIVMGSNVLNVSIYADDPLQSYNNTLDEMTRALKPDGTLIVNMPSAGPRADWMSPAQLKKDLMLRFNDIQHPHREVFIARLPKTLYNMFKGELETV